MMKITGHTIEKLEDPFGLLTGDRYELFLDIEVDEEDELYSEKGVALKIIYVIDGQEEKISHYHFFEQETGTVLDFAMEEDEEALVSAYCRKVITE